MGIQFESDKACKDFVESIATVENERCQSEFEGARFLCVLADGSTDKSITEQEALYVRFTGFNGRPSTFFADLVPIRSADAAGVTAAIQEGLQAVNVDETVSEKKLACCNFDGVSVMIGKKTGLENRLEEVAEHSVCVIHCVTHNMKLAVLDATKETPHLALFEEIVKQCSAFFIIVQSDDVKLMEYSKYT